MLVDHIHDQLGKYRTGFIVDHMPDFIKTAQENLATEDLTKLADGCFAYSDGVNRYFPIHTPEHTWMSRAYFIKCAETLDANVASMIKERIEEAAQAFEIPEGPGYDLSKTASTEDDIDSLHSLSTDIRKFVAKYKHLTIDERRKAAKELLHRSQVLNRMAGIPELISNYAGDKLADNYHHAFDARMRHFANGSEERSTLMKMQENASTYVPEVLARVLSKFDEMHNLHRHYDSELQDPFVSLLRPGCCAEPAIYEDDSYKIFPSELKSFDFDSLSDTLEESILNGLKSDPASIRDINPRLRIIVIRRIKGI